METLRRYDEVATVITPLDPLTDVVSWFRGLRSVSYVSDLLRHHHGFTDKTKIQQAARAIAAHAECGAELLETGLSVRSEQSFLMLYYGLLNVAKVVVIASGRYNALRSQRWHGATWSGANTTSHSLLTDHITLKGAGAIPLFYQALTRQTWPVASGGGRLAGRKVLLREIYPYISGVSHEYTDAYRVATGLTRITVEKACPSAGSVRAHITVADPAVLKATGRRGLPILAGLQESQGRFSTKTLSASSAGDALTRLNGILRRCLIYDDIALGQFGGTSRQMISFTPNQQTPICRGRLLLPEELPILLAFYHLSNVVRYDPERLEKLYDSKAAYLLNCLRRHGTYRFLLLCWSFVNQKTYLLLP